MSSKFVLGTQLYMFRADFLPETCRDVFYICVSVHHKSIIYNKPTRCNSGSIALQMVDAKGFRNM